jgi:hypothetical protein
VESHIYEADRFSHYNMIIGVRFGFGCTCENFIELKLLVVVYF